MCHVRKPLALAAGLNTLIFAGETLGGFTGHSNSLIMDGVHNFSDELALGCLYLAYLLPIVMSKNLQRMANVLNSIGLIGISGFVVWQSVERIIHPAPTIGYIPLFCWTFGRFCQLGCCQSLYPVKEQNAAIRLAYIHNLGDVYVSLAPVLAGILGACNREKFF